ncbi:MULTISPECIES: DUF4332 domain-containing protein [Prochlorococcus]|nr:MULTISPECIES: DUF4332 domain-containing protein [Prochlorococcus]KGG13916.1 hypothetical protein EV04_0401 [Prochlorococcus marinus str. LG]KGG23411.1 hypothetical protein EV09_1035 [Prochlorococcus marinus str. SS35]KGG32353.1 hypothetical protein EV10_1468 [Prochlorococcus marinus str. SS51]KGG37015.1 hypothetical protein EV11_0446 [Prochlorococcus sp. SS52]
MKNSYKNFKKIQKPLEKLLPTFKKEEKELTLRGFDSWHSIATLGDLDITKLIEQGCGTSRNLNCLRCIAIFICELDLLQEEAALLMHSGISSVRALANSSPQDLLTKISRLEIQLMANRSSNTDLIKINKWIEKAKENQKII